MTITSFSFLLLVAVGAAVYYLIPKSWQWVELLLLTLVFYYYAGSPFTIIYLIMSTLIAYVSTNVIISDGEESGKLPFALTIVAIAANLLIWFQLKGRDLWIGIADRLSQSGGSLLTKETVAALGMGYYTFQVIGYIVDCYWGSAKPQKNPLKLFLFVSYFPQLTTGPISRYNDLTTLYEGHSFSYETVTFGAQRILWGIVKKLVLAERVGIIVSAITAAPDTYTGFYSWLAILLYPVQMYADFSGCTDICLGVSEIFGIKLVENFNNPFFARTVQEFWQRWHISLGTWGKDYILYPLLKTKGFVEFGKKAKKKFGKKNGKFIVNLVAMAAVWLVIGLWHGAWKYVVGVSAWYWLLLMLGNLLAEPLEKVNQKLHIKTESFSWHLFQSARTYLVYAVGAVFFNVGVRPGFDLLKDAAKVILKKGYANPWIFLDGSILELGVSHIDINVMIVTVALLFVVGVLREKYGYARVWVQKQDTAFRWLIWLGLFAFILIYGKYGPDFSATAFIYQGF